MVMILLRYDLRAPAWASSSPSELYSACLEQCRWGDNLGFDMVVLSEHHGAEDGFMCSPITIAGAVAGATKKIGINISAALIPMHDPVRLAEQLATVDLLSQGRVSVIVGTGYRQEEFDMADIAFRDRMPLLEESIRVMQAAFTGEYFDYRGRQVRVLPKPHSPNGPFLMMGGSTEKAARRAARLGLGFAAADSNQQLADWYYDECKQVGFTGGFASVPPRLGFIHISEDPERDWARIAPHALHEAQVYASWQRAGQHSAVSVMGAETVDDLKASGVYRVITPAECVDMCQNAGDFGSVLFHPLMGGLSPDVAWESLELFANEVLPIIRPTAS